MAHPAKAKTHAHFARQRSHSAARDAEEAHLLNLAFIPEPVLLFRKFLSAATRAQNDSYAALLFHRKLLGINTRIRQGLARCRDCQRDNPRNMFALVRINPGQLVKVLNLAGNLHGK